MHTKVVYRSPENSSGNKNLHVKPFIKTTKSTKLNFYNYLMAISSAN